MAQNDSIFISARFVDDCSHNPFESSWAHFVPNSYCIKTLRFHHIMRNCDCCPHLDCSFVQSLRTLRYDLHCRRCILLQLTQLKNQVQFLLEDVYCFQSFWLLVLPSFLLSVNGQCRCWYNWLFEIPSYFLETRHLRPVSLLKNSPSGCSKNSLP